MTQTNTNLPKSLKVSALQALIAAKGLRPTPEDLACHYPKLIQGVFREPMGAPTVLPIQITLIGKQIAIVSIPGEPTTEAGRAIQEAVKSGFKEIPNLKVIIQGYANSYMGYITSYQQYLAQSYEGAHTLYGPGTLNHLTATVSKLAQSFNDPSVMISSEALPESQVTGVVERGLKNPNYPVSQTQGEYGKLLSQNKTQVEIILGAKRDPEIVVTFKTDDPRMNLRTNDTYFIVEKLKGNDWVPFLTDRDPETEIEWQVDPQEGTIAQITWRVAPSTPTGNYRIKFFGNFRSDSNISYSFESVSQWIEVVQTRISSALPQDPSVLKVLTLNGWILDVPAPNGIGDAEYIDERLARMPKLIAESGADVVFLQEIWRTEHRVRLAQDLANLGYNVIGVDTKGMGNGLLIVSKYPVNLAENRVKTFSIATRIDEGIENPFGENVIIAKKGVIHAFLEHPVAGKIELFNGHLGAVTYDHELGDRDPEHERKQRIQLGELGAFFTETRMPTFPVLFGIDLNAHYEDMEKGHYTGHYSEQYQFMRDLGLMDSYEMIHGRAMFPNPFEATFDPERNLFASHGADNGDPSEVIDYIFFANTAGQGSPQLYMQDSKIMFVEPNMAGEGPRPISDHYGVLSIFKVVQ